MSRGGAKRQQEPAPRIRHPSQPRPAGPGEATVALRMDDAFCERHRFLMMGTPPAVGFDAAALIMQAFVADPRVASVVAGEFRRVPTLIERHRPLCCFLGDAVARKVAAEAIRQGA